MIVPIFKGKGDVMSWGSYSGVKPLEHAMNIVEKVLERRIRINRRDGVVVRASTL